MIDWRSTLRLTTPSPTVSVSLFFLSHTAGLELRLHLELRPNRLGGSSLGDRSILVS